MDAARAFRAKTTCSSCQISATWEGTEGPSRVDVTCVDQESSFVCEHWRDHHEVIDVARDSETGKAQLGPVTGEFSWLQTA